MLDSPIGGGVEKYDVVSIRTPEGAVSFEFVPMREGVARGFVRLSPRNVKLGDESAKRLSDQLVTRNYSRILIQDTKSRSISKLLRRRGWHVERAVRPVIRKHCSMVTTYDLPVETGLIDEKGLKPEISNTSHMNGISVAVQDRKAWAFFTDDGETARMLSDGERRQGMFVVSEQEDMFEIAECLVQYLATARKKWAVFSTDQGRFIRQYDPIVMWRMATDNLRQYDHKAVPLSGKNRKAAIRLFSEYYDESSWSSFFRLSRMRNEGNYATFLVDGGFVILRYEGDTGLVYDIYVTPARQGEGLGAELMRCAMTAFAGKVSSVYLHTSYPRAKSLYEKFGFRVAHTQLGIRLDEVALTPPLSTQAK